MAKSEYTMLEVAGPRGPALEPAKVYFPKPGWTKLDMVDLLPDRGRRGADPPARAPDGDEALRQRDHGGPDLAEAGAQEPAGVAADDDRRVPVRADRRGAGGQRRGAPRVGGQPRRDRLQPAPGAARRPRPSGRAARRPRPDGRRQLGRRAPDGDGGRRGADRARPARLPEDVGLEGHPRQRAHRAEWSYLEVRRAALALAREIERRAPELATSKWWKEERHGVFVDYNQNARDRTVASAYSVRPTPDARVSCVLRWDEVPDVEPGDLRLDTVPERLRTIGDPAADMDLAPGSLEQLLDLARRDEEGGLGRRAVAAALPEGQGRAQARAAQPRRLAARPGAGDPQPGGPPPGLQPAAAARVVRLQAPDGPGPRGGIRGGLERPGLRLRDLVALERELDGAALDARRGQAHLDRHARLELALLLGQQRQQVDLALLDLRRLLGLERAALAQAA